MSLFKTLQGKKIDSWKKLQPDEIKSLMAEMGKHDYRIFPFEFTLKRADGQTEKIIWALPYSFIRNRLLSCPCCKPIVSNEIEKELERVELFRSYLSGDQVLKDVTEDAMKAFVTMFDSLNTHLQPQAEDAEQEEKQEPGKSKEAGNH